MFFKWSLKSVSSTSRGSHHTSLRHCSVGLPNSVDHDAECWLKSGLRKCKWRQILFNSLQRHIWNVWNIWTWTEPSLLTTFRTRKCLTVTWKILILSINLSTFYVLGWQAGLEVEGLMTSDWKVAGFNTQHHQEGVFQLWWVYYIYSVHHLCHSALEQSAEPQNSSKRGQHFGWPCPVTSQKKC